MPDNIPSPSTKKLLHDLSRRQDNKSCADCSNPNPQWASGISPISSSPEPASSLQSALPSSSVSSAAGVHRGFGVHIRHVTVAP
ncbi:hypothetical protein J3R82DRAFT_4170 [Butyriboletus roseoflavus]|nr:hypothetical protein J3R82DRAFT_4170 [Butyriboletus roseoflavus]